MLQYVKNYNAILRHMILHFCCPKSIHFSTYFKCELRKDWLANVKHARPVQHHPRQGYMTSLVNYVYPIIPTW